MEKFKEFMDKLNRLGVPLPFIRDPLTGKPSVSLTMMLIAFAQVQLALINKLANLFGSPDLQSSIYVLFGMSALYFGRKMQGDGKTIDLGEKSKDDAKSDK